MLSGQLDMQNPPLFMQNAPKQMKHETRSPIQNETAGKAENTYLARLSPLFFLDP
jgi:hypothetical protein